MDDLLREFLTETGESLDVVDVELVRFEQEPNNTKILDNIFRLVHTIKGTCGFLGLPRLEALTHAAETLDGKFPRRHRPVTGEAVTLVLATIDRIKALLDELERNQAEPEGNDRRLDRPSSSACRRRLAAPAPAITASPVRLAHERRSRPARSRGRGDRAGVCALPRDAQAGDAAPARSAAESHPPRRRQRRRRCAPQTRADRQRRSRRPATTIVRTARSRASRSACMSTRSSTS